MDRTTEEKYKQTLQKASAKIKELLNQVEIFNQRGPIAIVGMGCRFPGGANSPAEYWRLLEGSGDGVREVPVQRWDAGKYFDPDPEAPGKMYTSRGGFLDIPIDLFDAGFFGISPKEARSLDPQQRLLLEVSWEALEDAGIDAATLKGTRTGVFVGVSSDDYAQAHRHSGDLGKIDAYSITGSTFSTAIGRISYTFGLEGPNMAIDTACSSSLVALHLGCQSLRSGESDLALVGGVNLLLAPAMHICFTKLQALSADGRCKTFDAAANGYVRGEGCGMVVLKRLQDARAAGDRILAVVKGSAVNQDGKSNGLTAPNGRAQQRVIQEALGNAGVAGADISYVETHGTGTALGDPVEVEALGKVLTRGRPPGSEVVLGAVKTNIGHLEPAAGVAGIIKIILSMGHESIPANLNFQTPSPHIAWEELPFVVPTEPASWSREQSPRLAGISGFGFSGTNAHVILEEPPPQAVEESHGDRTCHLLNLSAKSPEALAELAAAYAGFLAGLAGGELGNVCHTANSGRALFDHRLSVLGRTPAEMGRRLQAYAENRSGGDDAGLFIPDPRQHAGGKCVFLFTGQGSQYRDMGRLLYETQPTFRKNLDRCAEILASHLDAPLLDILFAGEETGDLDETVNTQPALFALEYALARLWLSWGVEPEAVMGHSVGEYVAACVAGVFSLEDGLKLISARARLMHTLPRDGSMAAVLAGEERVEAALRDQVGQVAIAAVNGPSNTVISGKREEVKAVAAGLAAEGIETRPLKVSHAFHSPLMEPILAEFEKIASEVTFAPPRLELISNLTGEPASEEITSPAYWRRHIRQPVRFAASMETLARRGYSLFLEIGPKPTLVGMGRQCLPHADHVWLASLRQGEDDWQQLLQGLAVLHLHQVPVDWRGVEQDYPRQRVSLPTYPFQRTSHWVHPVADAASSSASRGGNRPAAHELLGSRVHAAVLEDTWLFEARLGETNPAYLKEHRVFEAPVMPAAGYLEMARAAGTAFFGTKNIALKDVVLYQGMILAPDRPTTVQLSLVPGEDGGTVFEISSLRDEDQDAGSAWTRHASGKIRVQEGEPGAVFSMEYLEERLGDSLPAAELYQHFSRRGIDFGPAFQAVHQIRRAGNEALGLIRLPEGVAVDQDTPPFHPVLLDACCFQMLGAVLFQDEQSETYLPVSVESLQFFGAPGAAVWSHVSLHPAEEEETNLRTGDLSLYAEDGTCIARAEGVSLKRITRDVLLKVMQKDLGEWLYRLTWTAKKQDPPPVATNPGPGTWLIFHDRRHPGSDLAALLEEMGDRCFLVAPGTEFSRESDTSYTVDPRRPEDYKRLIGDVFAGGDASCKGVIHMGASGGKATGALDSRSLREAQEANCGGVLHLLQALGESEAAGEAPRLFLVTRGGQFTAKEHGDHLAVAQASLWGFARVIALEHPELRCIRIDLDPHRDADDTRNLFAEIWNPGEENQIAWRHGERYLARLERSTFEQTPGDRKLPDIKQDGSYLITGGLGALGARVAHWLIAKGARHLILVGRSGGDTEKNAATIRQLEAAGATVFVVKGDVAQEEDVVRIFTEAKEFCPPVRGIFHTAGVLVEGVISQQNWQRFEQVLLPKIQGAWHLHRHSLDLDLDLFVCFSSIISLLGSMGQASYAAANAFLDALIHYRRSLNLPGLTINWGAWAEDGMAARAPEQWKQRIINAGIGIMPPEQAIEVLDRIAGRKAAQVAVVPITWSKFLQTPAGTDPFFENLHARDSRGGGPESTILQQLQAAEPGEAITLLDQYVCGQVAAVLCLPAEQLVSRQKLVELGFDSLMAVDLRNRLATAFGYQLPASLLFEEPSAAELVEHLAENLLPAAGRNRN